jgi:O-antigen ligase/tetratricopeptide (TPR) repeat protein
VPLGLRGTILLNMKDTLLAVVFGGLFLIPFLPLYVENDYFFPFITGKNFAFRIIVEVVFAAWVLLALVDVKYRPKFSWIVAGFAALMGAMAISTAVAEDPHTSFWSNFERMDGYITLVHVFLFTVVLGSVMQTEKLWWWFLNTSLGVALMVALYGLGQQVDIFEGGRGRVDSKLGNAAYMAIYMLFHIFFAYLLMLRTKVTWERVAYGVAAFILAYTLLQTGTRGTFLGLVGGSVVTVGYIALFARRFPHLRRYAIGGVVALGVAIVAFVGIRESSVIPQNSPVARIANINIEQDLQTRSKIWSMALEGVEERPVFGWGLGNFNFVFNEQYRADIWNQEQWFDRVHNIFLDWLIAGGVVGFIAYFSIMAAVVYYLFVSPVILKRETIFSVPEQAVLLGLLAAYLIHNVVVFDNIISYIFYGVLLALIHSRVGQPMARLEAYMVSEKMVGQFVAPLVIIVTGFAVYFINVPSMQAAGDIIDAMTNNTARGRLEEFHSALGRGSFANQEIVEQLAQQAMQIARTAQVPDNERQMIVQRAELELLRLADTKPGDARIHNFLASFYRSIGAVEKAREQSKIALSLSPNKPALHVEQALVELQANDLVKAKEYLANAYALEERNTTARIFYAAVLFRLGEVDAAKELIGDTYKAEFAMNDYGISSVEVAKDYAYLAELYPFRIAAAPDDAQNRASLAFLYYELDQPEEAVRVLETAASEIPSFAPTATCYASNIATGKDPSLPCAATTTTPNAN